MASEIILHIGQPKTGTTSLQSRLAGQRDVLLAGGVFYPKLAMNDINHRCLAPAIFKADKYSADIRLGLGGSPEKIIEGSSAQWDKLRENAPSDVLILSGENFFRPLTGDSGETLKTALSMKGYERRRILAYIRHPADRYLSFVQEQLKIITRIVAVKAYPFMDTLRSYRQVFGEDFQVRLYDRSLLKDADVFHDFVDWAGLDETMVNMDIKDDRPNHSFSAEAMKVLTQLQGRTRRKSDAEVQQNRRKLNALRKLDRAVPGATKPTLKPKARARIERGSFELLALREEFDLSFPGVDYSKIDPRGETEKMVVTDFSQICDFDEARFHELKNQLKTRLPPEELNLADT